MDPRVCAASLRSLLRPWMTKRWNFSVDSQGMDGEDMRPATRMWGSAATRASRQRTWSN